MKTKTILTSLSAALHLLGFASISAHAANSTWSGATSGTWTDATNWNAGVPGVSGLASNNTQVATFMDTGAGAITVDSAYSLGTLTFSSTTAALTSNYTLSGSTLRLNTSPSIQVLGGAFVNTGSVAVNNDILLFTNSTFSTANPNAATPAAGSLTLGGSVSLEPTVATNRKLTLTAGLSGTNSATVIVNGSISNGGTSGALLSIDKTGNGLARITNSNSYGGGTLLSGGLLAVGSDTALGTGQITFGSGALAADGLTARSLSNAWATGTNSNLTFGSVSTANNVNATNAGAITLTNSGTLVRSSAANTQIIGYTAVTLAGNISEAGGFAAGLQYDGQAIAGTSLTLTGTNSFTGNVQISRGTVIVNSLTTAGNAQSLGSGTGSVILGTSGNATLRYTGTNTSSNRQISLNATTAATLEANGSSGALTMTGDIIHAGTVVGRTFTLSGTNTNDNTFSGLLANGLISGTVSTLSMAKSGAGTWVLSGSNSYTGSTTINEGTLKVSSLNSVVGGSATSSLGAPTTSANGTIALGSGSNTGRLVYTGAGETTDRIISLSGTAGGGGVIDQSGTGLLKFSSNLANPPAGSGNRTLTLQGSTGGTGEIAGVIRERTAVTDIVSVTKAGTGTWTLSATNTYTGATTVTSGTLAVSALGSINNSTLVDLKDGGTFDTTAKATFTMIGTQTFKFTLNAAGAGTAGLVNAGGLNISAGVVDFATIGTLNDSAYIIASYTSLAGSFFATVNNLPSGYSIDYNYLSGNQIALVIPEPGTFAILLGGIGMLTLIRRRRA